MRKWRGGAGETSNWPGTFIFQNRCDRSLCCCPDKEMILSTASANKLRVQSQFVCPDAKFSLNETIQAPSGFTITLLFVGDPIYITLSQDSRTIQFSNAESSECSEVAIRNEPIPDTTTKGPASFTTTIGGTSTATINLTFMPLLVGLIIIKLFTI